MRDLLRSMYLTSGVIQLGSRDERETVRKGMHQLIFDRIFNSKMFTAVSILSASKTSSQHSDARARQGQGVG